MQKKKTSKPIVLMVLDGWGVAPSSEGNGISLAKTPNFEKYISSYPAMTLLASGESVGLSWGEMGNSEVGHLNLGTGRIFYQNLPRIDKAIEDETIFENKVLVDAIEYAKKKGSKVHLMGLVSEGKVHAMNTHCYALLELAKKNKFKDVYVHAFLDGRDTKFNSGSVFISELEKKMSELKVGTVATLHGRMYAMDRDNRWERIQKSYDAIVQGKSEEHYKSTDVAIKKSYDAKVYDEEFVPVVMGKEDEPVAKIEDNDVVIFFNYRADRTRELSRALMEDKFKEFDRGTQLEGIYFVTMTEYAEELNAEVVFPREVIKTSLPKILSEKGFKQLHVAETEKYAHVTFFFSGGEDEPYEGETRVVVPSPRIATYAEKPEMSAKKLSENIVKEVLKDKYDFIVVNYANPDMVSHTGEIEPTIAAIEATDKYMGEVIDLVLSKGGQAIIVADHGNAEELLNLQTGEKDKEHSTNPVPCILVGKEFEGKTVEDVQIVGNDLSLIQPVGLLSDIAPTVLKLLDVEIPDEMSGKPLV
jgi:2,3-bisphosphoglycerate-independent phosphoglycerate mutase